MLTKIYNGVVIDMATSKVISEGEISYVDSKDITHLGGGGGQSSSTTGFAEEYKPQIKAMMDEGKALYDSGELGAVAGFNENQIAAQAQGVTSAGNQTALEQSMMDQANKGVDLSGMRTAAKDSALNALGMNASNASSRGGLGGGRQMLNNQSVANNLAGTFATIDQQEQATNFANKNAALGVQGKGAASLAGVGAGQQQQAQNQADSAYKGLSQYASIFHGIADKQTTTTQTGGK